MPRPGEKSVQPLVREDRQLDAQNRELRAAFGDVYMKLEEQNQYGNRIVPGDRYTALWWPLNEFDQPTFHNEGYQRGTAEMLTPLATCGPSLGGLLWGTCARMYGADATRHAFGAQGMTASDTPVASVSCWIKPGAVGGGTSRLIFGYFNSTFANATIYVGITGAGLPFAQVESVAGVRSVIAPSDSAVTVGQWRHLVGTYDGANVAIYVDGVGASSTFAASPLNWALASSPRWVLGNSTAQGYTGLIQDCRFHSVPRSQAWAHDVWRRGMGFFGQQVRL